MIETMKLKSRKVRKAISLQMYQWIVRGLHLQRVMQISLRTFSSLKILYSILEFEKNFRRSMNEDKQQKAFLQVQMNQIHKEKRLIEFGIKQVDQRAQWCQDEIGYDND
ncbi:UNKNOWN [Stylonychia lemnae]|uniref:Uncharacterized protein n=1 Tax=Stylonychia lemnae TaxID=5949 RepID=A0A077ZZ30_STYLE|nr:UNKNOWN [Stylonychia lemnae]|eukprot:CDW75211.1 UNKNOWN [Stylonychia lemnae]